MKVKKEKTVGRPVQSRASQPGEVGQEELFLPGLLGFQLPHAGPWSLGVEQFCDREALETV